MNNLYKKAFETYDLIVNWVIENHNDVVDDITKEHLNIDLSYRLLEGVTNRNERLEKALVKACLALNSMNCDSCPYYLAEDNKIICKKCGTSEGVKNWKEWLLAYGEIEDE